ncbi:hypothetical protein P4E94_14320 [Pontiellaceae bacterium B12219]|nr:hypothetical protein [Pontiellaceae bacterium B12219]
MSGRTQMVVMIRRIFAVAVCGMAAVADASEVDRHYSFIYFEQGYPTRLLKYRRSEAMADKTARANPDVVVQTGFYTLRLDCDTMQLSGFDAVEGSDYLTALNQDVTVFSPAKLVIRIEQNGVVYTCASGIVQDKADQHVRLIESGQYVQRFDHIGLVFIDKFGKELDGRGRLEITAWADHVAFQLDMSGVEGVSKSGIQIVSPAGKVHRAGGESDMATLVLVPHEDEVFQPLETSVYIKDAIDLRNKKKLDVVFDEDEQALRFDLPMERVQFPKDWGRVDEYVIEVKNPTGEAVSLPLIFNEIKPQAITGTSMLLCEDPDGRPSGIPVQISKNWHNDKEHRVKHDGPWLRGYTMVPLKGGETRRLRLRVVTGFWGNVPAVSYSHLSVIGYGGNWKWDESALGAWGESMCYDPSQHLGAAFITDVRPSFTPSKQGKPYNWTENVGGGDFLVYFDKDNTYRWVKKLKTAFYWTGPNVTEVHYSGITDDDAIRFNYRIRSVRTFDYHRRFHSYSYEFLKDVETPQRLVFHQLAADYYNTVTLDDYYVGDATGMKKAFHHERGRSGYASEKIPFNDSWLLSDDTGCNDRNAAIAYGRRALLNMSSTLNGEPFPVYIHPFSMGRSGDRVNFDLSADSVSRSYKAGDIVEGELEFILPAKTAADYWGDDQEFAGRLKAAASNPWKMAADEFTHNILMEPTVSVGQMLNTYPLEIEVLEKSEILTDFTIQSGGIGHVPIILRNVPAGSALKVERFIDGKWADLEAVDLEQNSYYQGIRTADGTMDCLFNINRPSSNLNESWRIRIIQSAQ